MSDLELAVHWLQEHWPEDRSLQVLAGIGVALAAVLVGFVWFVVNFLVMISSRQRM